MADIKHKLKKYKQYFEANPDGDKVLSVLRKLDALPVSIALLQDTGIGKVVNSFRKKPDEIGALAKSIVAKWKTLVTREAKKTTQQVELNEEQYVPDSSRKPQKYEVTYKPTPIGEESPSGNEYSPQHVEQSYSPERLPREESIEPHYSPGKQSEENSDDEEYHPRSLSPKYSKKVGYSPTRIGDRPSEGEDEEYDPENVAVSNDQVYSPKSVSDNDAYDVATPEASASEQSASEDEEYNPSCVTKESSKYQASYTPTPISESDKPHKSSKDSKYNKKDSSSSGKYQSNSSDRTKHSSHGDKHSSHSKQHSSHSDKSSSHSDKHSSHSDKHSSKNDKQSTGNDKYSIKSHKQSSNQDKHDSSKVKQSSKNDKQDSEKYRNGSSSSNQSVNTSSSKKSCDKKTSSSDKKTTSSDKHSSSNAKDSRHSDKKSSSYDKDKSSVEGHKKSISVNTLPSSSDKRPSSGDKHSSTSNNKPSSSSKHSSSSDKKSSISNNRPSSSNKHSSDNRTSSSSKHSSDKSPRSSEKLSSSSDKKSSSDKLSSNEKATKKSNHQHTEIKKSKSDKPKSEKRKIQPMVDTSDLFSPDETAVIKKVKAVHRKPEENTKSTKNISHDEKKDSKSKSSSSSAVKSHSKAKLDKTSSDSKSSFSTKGEKRKKDEDGDEIEPANDITEGFSFDDFLNCDVKAVKKKPRKDVIPDLKPTGTKWSSSLVSSKPSTSRRAKNDDLPSTSFSMPSPAKQKIDIHESDILDLLPETNAHYRPLSKIPERKLDMATFDPMVIGTKTGKRTMVYSGKKHGLTEMKPLFGLCMQVLIDNIDALDYVGCIPYEILKPVLERCTVQQLLRLEDLNPHFVGDTEELWAIHCERDFKREQPDEMEAWREMYLRLQEEREVKLERLRLNMNKQAAAKPKGRQVQLAYVDNYVKPPRDVLRKQQRYGTAKMVAPSNSLHGASSSGKPRSSYNPHVAVPQPRMTKSVAPMMQKINKLISKRRQ
ncbi:transcription elongation factor B polypeptide 3 [Patella vulgata]|uniref:transcription elongation factor B polypeptide 3 n=1 Tax=Patella vulgata TaxID=6465 RepID=UPI00217FA7CD|nr:transcription elongation factor B polypeptide 3 [Patella vulgata]